MSILWHYTGILPVLTYLTLGYICTPKILTNRLTVLPLPLNFHTIMNSIHYCIKSFIKGSSILLSFLVNSFHLPSVYIENLSRYMVILIVQSELALLIVHSELAPVQREKTVTQSLGDKVE